MLYLNYMTNSDDNNINITNFRLKKQQKKKEKKILLNQKTKTYKCIYLTFERKKKSESIELK